ncbi:MAG: ECF transporter S component [Oscillospiraceae bacterium]|jgi:riboflavin transporter FmnP|nr:ECF transporter S component [Oscillospiraceae bacterium]
MSTATSTVAAQRSRTHRIAVTAMLSAAATVLMFLEFPIPFLIPSFVELDFSELPALLAAFSLGPVSGVVVCLVKNVIKGLLFSGTGGVGEMCNFLLGICFIIPAGLIYRYKRTRSGALMGALAGAVIMAVCSIPVNYFISYPVYTKFLPMDVIISMYQEIVQSFNGLLSRAGAPFALPAVNGLLGCLIAFNAPFTLLKGLLDMGLCFLIYKPLSPLLHR